MDDAELLRLFAQEESKHYAFNLLVKQYHRRVYMVIRKMVIVHEDADDLTQEVFLRVWNKLDAFQGMSSLFTWLYRIATNEALAHLRRKRLRFFIPIHDVEGELLNHLQAPSAYLDGDEAALTLQKALLQLPEKQRLVFNLKYFEDLTYEQMQEITGTSIGALKASYHLAVKKLQVHLGQPA